MKIHPHPNDPSTTYIYMYEKSAIKLLLESCAVARREASWMMGFLFIVFSAFVLQVIYLKSYFLITSITLCYT